MSFFNDFSSCSHADMRVWISVPTRSRSEKHLPRGSASGQCLLGGGCLLEWIVPVDGYSELTGANPGEEIAGAPLQLLAGGDVVAQCWPCQEEGAFGVENLGVDWGDGSARLAEEHQISARTQAI